MSRSELKKAYDCLTPSPGAKVRMYNGLLERADRRRAGRRWGPGSLRRVALAAAFNCLAVVLGVAAALALRPAPAKLPLSPPVLAEPSPTAAPERGLEELSLGLWELGMGGETAREEMISLQGFRGSPEYEAALAWQRFLANYDPDGSILAQSGNSYTSYGEKYSAYICYTREMAGQVDALCERYGLVCLTGMRDFDTPEELLRLGWTGAFFSREGPGWENEAGMCYGYEDGSFFLEGDLRFTGDAPLWPLPLPYQLTRCAKGSFSTLCLNIGSAADYDQWHYTSAAGADLLLARSGRSALVVAERPESFVVLHVLDPVTLGKAVQGEQSLDRETLEAVADCFDFSQIP